MIVTSERVVFQFNQRSCCCEIASYEETFLLREIGSVCVSTSMSPWWLRFGIFFLVIGIALFAYASSSGISLYPSYGWFSSLPCASSFTPSSCA